MTYVVAYFAALIIFGAIDMAWLTLFGAKLYRNTLGDVLLPTVVLGPAIVFYLLYPAGLVIFGVAPALKAGSVMPALIYGALFGLFCYATYDLTNFATLRNWTLQITALDVAYGFISSGIAAAAAYLIASYLGASK